MWECVVAKLVKLARLSVKKYDRRYLLKLSRAAMVEECVGARLVEL